MITLLYVTASSIEEAQKISETLLSEKLIACANIFPNMISIYNWENKLEKNEEVVVILKSSISLVPQIEERIKILHSYKVPCVISINPNSVSKEYKSWLLDALKPV